MHPPTGPVVCAALDPVLVPLGFAAGQHSDGVESQTIFCAAYDEFALAYPHLPQAGEQTLGVGACVDLAVDVGATGRIVSVDLEARGLESTLRHVGLSDQADRLEAGLRGPLDDQVRHLRLTLARLFAVPAEQRRPLPTRQPGPVSEPELIEVDGETFEVTADPDVPGQHHLTWTTGPNPDYGFTTRRSDHVYASRDELVDGIRGFLSQIDPETGYLD